MHMSSPACVRQIGLSFVRTLNGLQFVHTLNGLQVRVEMLVLDYFFYV